MQRMQGSGRPAGRVAFESGSTRGQSLSHYRQDAEKCAKTPRPGDLLEARQPSWEWAGRACGASCGRLPTCTRRVSGERRSCQWSAMLPILAQAVPSARMPLGVPTFFTPSRMKQKATSLTECPHHDQDVSAKAKPCLDQLKIHIPRRLAGEASRGGDFTAEIWRQERTWGGVGGQR